MILQSLCGYYDRLARDPGSQVAQPGWAWTPVSACIGLDAGGRVASIRSLTKPSARRPRPALMLVPMPPKRSGLKPEPAFLCDNAEFILGISQREDDGYRFHASRDIHRAVLNASPDEGARAVLRFFEQRIPGRTGPDAGPLAAGGNLVFALEGHEGYIHERPAIREAWRNYRDRYVEKTPEGQCLATGETAPIARIHGSLAGFGPNRPTLVGFNQESFTSYRKQQGMNAPVSQDAAFKYVTALNALMGDAEHRLTLHNDTVLVWAQEQAPREEQLFLHFLRPRPAGDDRDAGFHEMFAALMSGADPRQYSLDAGMRLFILALSANKSRVIVRLFHSDTFGALVSRMRDHCRDTAIAGNAGSAAPSVYSLARETALHRDAGHVAPSTESMLLRSVLDGTPYPCGIYHQMMQRIRSEACGSPTRSHGFAVSRERAGFIKGYLNRSMGRMAKVSGRMMDETLDSRQTHPAYLLGRLFALAEKAQRDVLDIQSGIAAKYLNAALASPRTVFPALLALARQYISQNPRQSKSSPPYLDSAVGRVLEQFPETDFPATLSPDEQGIFIIGYYHQTQALYTPKNDAAGAGQEEYPND